MDSLWENASPSSNFPAQKIPVDLNEYNYAGILPIHAVNDDGTVKVAPMVIIPINQHGITITFWRCLIRRDVLSVTTTGISFDDAYKVPAYNGTAGSEVVDNSAMIPYEIYGIKMS